MKVVAKVKEVCPVITGTSDNGNDWEKQQIVFETCDLEPKVLVIDFMGERKTKTSKTLKVGDKVEVSFVIRCNEYMGKWYTHLEGGQLYLVARKEYSAPEESPQGAAPVAMKDNEEFNDDLFRAEEAQQ